VTELQDAEAPVEVRTWVGALPAWCAVRRPASLADPETLAHLGAGEREAILLAQEVRAEVVLMDEQDGRQAARSRGLTVTGTLGVLERAAERGLLDLPSTLARLVTTSFRVRDELIQGMLARDAARRGLRSSARTYALRPFPPTTPSRHVLLTPEAWARSLCQPGPYCAFLMPPTPRPAAQKAA
jgi:predicted nucleic acid-binding protein